MGSRVFPYTRLEMIVNPWGYNCLPVLVRLDENARVEFVLRNRSISDLDKLPDQSLRRANHGALLVQRKLRR